MNSLGSNNSSLLAGIKRPQAAFTLMEILIAVVILAIVMTTIMASFDSVFSTTQQLDSSFQTYEMAKNCLERMRLDLEAIYINQPPLYKPPAADASPDLYRLVGSESDAGGTGFAVLRFSSRAHVPSERNTRRGIAEIVYYVSMKSDGQAVLKRSDRLYPYPPFEARGADPVLCRQVKSLAFKFYDQQGEEFEQWDSESRQFGYATPTAVGIVLEVGGSGQFETFETMVRLPIRRRRIDS